MQQIRDRIFIEPDKLKFWTDAIKLPGPMPDAGLAAVLGVFHVDIGKGIDVDIRLCNHQDGPFVDIIMFDDGEPTVAIDKTYKILGHHTFVYRDTAYSIEIVEEPETTKGPTKNERKKIGRVRDR